ncbi:MAG: UDP-N-acetylmuramoyl-tripeptide--D-alanyl-D-alanine ligase [Bacteroidales bacterium]|jgi:UDP-N-acetylmuramoyl-tripeptide--D-alanyl-D-alanine ligase|nr:UDP-N-acetylmuramoyl-tripeptide--D-alanyl-D-alanine ligase [Bacteroidales bacterium]
MQIDDLYTLFTRYPKVVTDTRKAETGSIFFALKGEQFDGNDFAATALHAGCAYAVVDKPDVAIDERFILVEDTLAALQDLARFHRRKFTIPVIAVTGTNGKTTTKELMKSVLSSKYQVLATSGNLNNHIGVPLTLLQLNRNTEMAIIEMGANHQQEISLLCNIAEPTHGLITNIGKAHLEGFGGFQGVKKAKKELYDYLDKHKGTIFFNATNPVLKELLAEVQANMIAYGESPYIGRVLSASPYLYMELSINEKTYTIQTHLAGAYNLENIVSAACIGDYFQVPEEEIIISLSGYVPQNNRSQVLQTGRNLLLLDYYNANPTSMKESLNNFFEQVQGKRMTILGDMFELGLESAAEHAEIVRILMNHPETENIVVGRSFFEAAKDIPGIRAFEDIGTLKDALANDPPEAFTILIKGSRGMKLEQLQELL